MNTEETEILRQRYALISRGNIHPFKPLTGGLPKLYAQDFPREHRILLLKIASLQQTDDEADILALTRGCWRLDRNRAECADIILAVCKQIIVGVFTAEKWFPVEDGIDKGRFAFIAAAVPDTIRGHYYGKYIISLPDGKNIKAQNPVNYINC